MQHNVKSKWKIDKFVICMNVFHFLLYPVKSINSTSLRGENIFKNNFQELEEERDDALKACDEANIWRAGSERQNKECK